MEKIKIKVPELAELFSDNPTQMEQSSKLIMLLNQEPNKDWIKEHPQIKGFQYIPIEKIELMLGRIFGVYKIEILREGLSFNGNGVHVVCRVHYWNPVLEQMAFHDGIGAVALTKRDDLQPAFPTAKTLAIKDACDHFGKIFGRDLNRSRSVDAVAEMILSDEQILDVLYQEKKGKLAEDQVANIGRIIENKEKTSYKKAIKYLKSI